MKNINIHPWIVYESSEYETLVIADDKTEDGILVFTQHGTGELCKTRGKRKITPQDKLAIMNVINIHNAILEIKQ
jgi:hypothetical protein